MKGEIDPVARMVAGAAGDEFIPLPPYEGPHSKEKSEEDRLAALLDLKLPPNLGDDDEPLSRQLDQPERPDLPFMSISTIGSQPDSPRVPQWYLEVAEKKPPQGRPALDGRYIVSGRSGASLTKIVDNRLGPVSDYERHWLFMTLHNYD